MARITCILGFLLSTGSALAFGHEVDLGDTGPSVPDAVAETVSVETGTDGGDDDDDAIIRDADDLAEDYLDALRDLDPEDGEGPISLLDGDRVDPRDVLDALSRSTPADDDDAAPISGADRDLILRLAQNECQRIGGARLVVRGWQFSCQSAAGDELRP